MDTKSLLLPSDICPICNKKFIRTSSIAIIGKKIITHAIKTCSMGYLIGENQKLPEDKQERMSFWDVPFRFTEEYEKSNKAITEEQLKNYQAMFSKVIMLTDPIIVKRIVRDRIWKGVGRKYLEQLQTIHLLNRIYEKNKDKWQTNSFKSTFVPSVLGQFKSKGYLSKKQWELVDRLVNENATSQDREYWYMAISKASDMSTLEVPDMLRFMQRKEDFMEYYNKQHNIPEESN